MAQLNLRHPNEAVTSALTAYEIGVETGSASTRNAVSLVLEAKKAKWEAKERERLRQRSEMLRELEDSLIRNGAAQVDETNDPVEIEETKAATQRKIEELYSIFAIADPVNMQKREVPDYMIDNISFAFMHDPVMTKSGQSYERSTIEAHLKTSPTDPLTREPLRKEELRSNLALKQACAEFLENNGWAVDW
jgi:STIP1 homology and U-box containing protein 1